MGIKGAKKIIRELNWATLPFNSRVQTMIEKALEAYAEPDLVGGLQNPQEEPPQLEVGDIVKSNNERFPILKVAELTLTGNYKCVTPDNNYVFFHPSQIERLFPTHLVPKESGESENPMRSKKYILGLDEEGGCIFGNYTGPYTRDWIDPLTLKDAKKRLREVAPNKVIIYKLVPVPKGKK